VVVRTHRKRTTLSPGTVDPFLKLTAKAPENGCFSATMRFLFAMEYIIQGCLAVSFREFFRGWKNDSFLFENGPFLYGDIPEIFWGT